MFIAYNAPRLEDLNAAFRSEVMRVWDRYGLEASLCFGRGA